LSYPAQTILGMHSVNLLWETQENIIKK
jgi:hypothetical protein